MMKNIFCRWLAVLAIAGIVSCKVKVDKQNEKMTLSKKHFITENGQLRQQSLPFQPSFATSIGPKDSISKSDDIQQGTDPAASLQDRPHIDVAFKGDEKLSIDNDPLHLGSTAAVAPITPANDKPKKLPHHAPLAQTYLGEDTDEVVTPQESLASMVSKPIYQGGSVSMYMRRTPGEESNDGDKKYMYSPEDTENNEMMRERDHEGERESEHFTEPDRDNRDGGDGRESREGREGQKNQESENEGYNRENEGGRHREEERYPEREREREGRNNEDQGEQRETEGDKEKERYVEEEEHQDRHIEDQQGSLQSQGQQGQEPESDQGRTPFREESSFRNENDGGYQRMDNNQNQDHGDKLYPEREKYFRDGQDSHAQSFDKSDTDFPQFHDDPIGEKPMMFSNNNNRDGYSHEDQGVSDGIDDRERERAREDKRERILKANRRNNLDDMEPLRKHLINKMPIHKKSKAGGRRHLRARKTSGLVHKSIQRMRNQNRADDVEYKEVEDGTETRRRRSEDSSSSYDAYGSIGMKVPQNLPTLGNGAEFPAIVSDRPVEAEALVERTGFGESPIVHKKKCGEDYEPDQSNEYGYKRRIQHKKKKLIKIRTRRSTGKDSHTTAKKPVGNSKKKTVSVTSDGKKKKMTDRDYVGSRPDERSTEHSGGMLEDNEQRFLQSRLDRDAEPFIMKIAEHDRDDFHKLWDNSHSPGNGYYAGNGEGPARPYLGDYLDHNVEDAHHTDRFDPLVPVNSAEHNVEAHAAGDQSNEDSHTSQLIDAIWDHDNNDEDKFNHGSHHVEDRPGHSQKVLSYFNHRDHDVLLPTETLDGIAGHWDGGGGGGGYDHGNHWNDEYPQGHAEHHEDPNKSKAIQAIQDDPSIDSDLQTLGVGIEMNHARHGNHGGGHEGLHGLHDVGVLHGDGGGGGGGGGGGYHEGGAGGEYGHEMPEMHGMHDVHDLHESPHPEHMDHLMEGLESQTQSHEQQQIEESHEEEYKQHNDALLHHYHNLEEHMKGLHGSIFNHLDEGAHNLHHHSHNRYHSGVDLYAYKNPWDNIRLPYHIPVANHPVDSPAEPEAGGGSHEEGGKGDNKGDEKGGPLAGEGGKEGPLAGDKPPDPVDDKAKGGEPAKEGKGDKKPWGNLPLPVIPKQRGGPELLPDSELTNATDPTSSNASSPGSSAEEQSAAQMSLLQHASKQFMAGAVASDSAAAQASGNKVTAMQAMLESMLKDNKPKNATDSPSAAIASMDSPKEAAALPAMENATAAGASNLDPLQIARLQQLSMMQEAMQKSPPSPSAPGPAKPSDASATATDIQSKILQLQALAAVASSAAPEVAKSPTGLSPASLLLGQMNTAGTQPSIEKSAKLPQVGARKVLGSVDSSPTAAVKAQNVVPSVQASSFSDILKGLKQKLAVEQAKVSPLGNLLQSNQSPKPGIEEKSSQEMALANVARLTSSLSQEGKMKQFLGGMELPRGTSKDIVTSFQPKLAIESQADITSVEHAVEAGHSASSLGSLLLKKAEQAEVSLKQLKPIKPTEQDIATPNASSATLWKDAILQQLSDKGKRRHHLGLKLVAKSRSENPYSTIGFEPPSNDAMEETGSKREGQLAAKSVAKPDSSLEANELDKAQVEAQLQKSSSDISLHDDARDTVYSKDAEKVTTNGVAKAKVPSAPTEDDVQSKKSQIKG